GNGNAKMVGELPDEFNRRILGGALLQFPDVRFRCADGVRDILKRLPLRRAKFLKLHRQGHRPISFYASYHADAPIGIENRSVKRTFSSAQLTIYRVRYILRSRNDESDRGV